MREEIERIAESDTFRNAESLRRLLRYLGDVAIQGAGRDVKEYTVGVEALGRPKDYDPRTDSSVRVLAGKLRQKIEEYYRNESRESTVRVEFPKGHFELKFVDSTNGLREDQGVPVRSRWRLAAVIFAALVMVAAAAWLIGKNQGGLQPATRAGAVWLPEQEAFWRPFLDRRLPLLVVIGDPIFLRFHSMYFRDPDVNNMAEAKSKLPLDEMQRVLKSPTPPTETHRFLPLGESVAAFQLATLLAPHRPDLQLKRSTAFAWEDVRSNHLIFLGPRKFNPQLRDLPVEQDFVVENRAIWNRRPQLGEQESYQKPSAPELDEIPEEYSLITRVGGIPGWGELLVLASTSTEGTWAAAEYLRTRGYLRELSGRIKLPDGSLPDAYQAVIKTKFKSQVPIQSHYVTHHVLKPARP
jgi:hypothetical protein